MFRALLNACLGVLSFAACAAPLGTAFTYQGRLVDATVAANDLYDFEFCVFASMTGGSPLVCSPQTATADLPVVAGVFTATVDVGPGVFTGEQRFLEVRVRQGNSTAPFDVLAPRQVVRATPESLHAPWAGLSGLPAGFADNVDDGVVSITAGTGLSGGTVTTTGTFNVDLTAVQARIAVGCDPGEYFRAVAADGSVACEPVAAPPTPRSRTVDTGASGALTHVSMAVGSDGLPAISFYDSGKLRFLKCADPACSQPVASRVLDAFGNVGEFSSIAMASNGFPVVAYFDRGFSAVKLITCTTPDCSGAFSARSFNVGSVSPDGLALALDSGNIATIAFVQSGAALRVLTCASVACTNSSTVTLVGGSPRRPSMAIPSNGAPLIAFFQESSGDLFGAKCVAAGCGSAITTQVDSAGNAGDYSSVALDGTGLPWISYRSDTSVKLVRCQSVDCAGLKQFATLDATAGAGLPTAAMGTPSGNPAIVYFDAASGKPRIAYCYSPACNGAVAVAIVDAGSNLGSALDAALGTDGLPVLAYPSGAGSAALTVTRCNTSTCQ